MLRFIVLIVNHNTEKGTQGFLIVYM